MVGVLASHEDGQVLQGILIALAEAGVDAYGLKIHPNWESVAPARLVARFEKATHFLALASESSIGSLWFSFAVGYGYSRGAKFSLYRFDPALRFPRFLSGLPFFDGIDELAGYYKGEKDDWLVEDERRASRAALLEMGISVHNESLALCVIEGDTKAIELFMRAGFSADTRDRHGVPLLCLAARAKHRAVAEILLKWGAGINLQSEDRGYSALMDAALAGSPDLVAVFLKNGAQPDLRSKDGQTALIVAVGRSDLEASALLIGAGADPDLADKLGLSARKYAALFKNKAINALFESIA